MSRSRHRGECDCPDRALSVAWALQRALTGQCYMVAAPAPLEARLFAQQPVVAGTVVDHAMQR